MYLAVGVTALVVTSTVIYVLGGTLRLVRHNLSQAWFDIFESILRPAQSLDVVSLQRRIIRAAVAAAPTTTVSGKIRSLPHVWISVSPSDLRVLQGGPQPFYEAREEMQSEVRRKLADRRVIARTPLTLTIVSSGLVRDGRPVAFGAAEPNDQGPGSTDYRALMNETVTSSMSEQTGVGSTAPFPRTMPDRTAPRRPVSAIPAGRLLAVPGSAPSLDLVLSAGRRVTLGRGGDILISHPKVSLRHLAIAEFQGVWTVEDLKSTNGTFLNGARITTSKLSTGDRLQLGRQGPQFKFVEGR